MPNGITDTLLKVLKGENGPAILSRYAVDLSGPAGKVGGSGGGLGPETLQSLVSSVNLPGKTLNSVEYSLWDKPIALPTGYANDDFSMEFIIPNSFKTRHFFDRWISMIIDPGSKLISYQAEYRCDINVTILDETGSGGATTFLTDCYPLSYSSIPLDSSNNEIAKMTVKLAYKEITLGSRLGQHTPTASDRASAANRARQILKDEQARGNILPDGVTLA